MIIMHAGENNNMFKYGCSILYAWFIFIVSSEFVDNIIIVSESTGILDVFDYSSIFVTPGYHKLEIQGASFLDNQQLKYIPSKQIEYFFDGVHDIRTDSNASVTFVIVEGTNVSVLFESDFMDKRQNFSVDVNILLFGGSINSLVLQHRYMDKPTYSSSDDIYVYPQLTFTEPGILHSCEMKIEQVGIIALVIMRPPEPYQASKRYVDLYCGSLKEEENSNSDVPQFTLIKQEVILIYANETGSRRFKFNTRTKIKAGDVIGLDFSKTTARLSHYFFGRKTVIYKSANITSDHSLYHIRTSNNASQPIMCVYLSKPFVYEFKIMPQKYEGLLSFDATVTWKGNKYLHGEHVYVQVPISGLRIVPGKPRPSAIGGYKNGDKIEISAEVYEGSAVQITGYIPSANLNFNLSNNAIVQISSSLIGEGFHQLHVSASNRISKDNTTMEFAILKSIKSFEMMVPKTIVDINEPVRVILEIHMGSQMHLQMSIGKRSKTSEVVIAKNNVTVLEKVYRFYKCEETEIMGMIDDFVGNKITKTVKITIACYVQGLSVMTIPKRTTDSLVRLSISDMLQIEISLKKGSFVTYFTEWGDNETETIEEKTSLYPKDFGMRHKYDEIGNYTLKVTAKTKNKNISSQIKIQVVKCFVPPVMFFYGSEKRPVVIPHGRDKIFIASWNYLDRQCFKVIESDFIPEYWIIQSKNGNDTKRAIKEHLKVKYHLKKLSLDPGEYKIYLVIKYRMYNYTFTGYFKIKQSLLVAEISNGIFQTIPLKQLNSEQRKSFYNFRIKGIDSYDPGNREDGIKKLALYWRCICKSNDAEISEAKSRRQNSSFVCLDNKNYQNLSSYEKSHGYVEFSTNAFLENIIYKIALTVGQQGRKTSTAYQKFEFVSGAPPNINIRCINNCERKINPFEKFSLQYECINCSEHSEVVGRWQLQKEIDENTKIPSGINESSLATSLSSPNLVVKANTLKENTTYIMSLIVHYKDRSSYSKAVFRKTVSMLPFGGSCEVWPNNGEAGITKFNFKCRNWQNKDAPTFYEIRYTRFEETKFSQDLPILNSGTLDLPYLTNVIMPTGLPSSNYKIGISVRIINKYGAFATYEKINMTVKPPDLSEENFHVVLAKLFQSFPKDINNTQKVTMSIESIVSIVSLKLDEVSQTNNATLLSIYKYLIGNTFEKYGKYLEYLNQLQARSFTELKCIGDTLATVTKLLTRLPPIQISLDPAKLLQKLTVDMADFSDEQGSQYMEMSFQSMFSVVDNLIHDGSSSEDSSNKGVSNEMLRKKIDKEKKSKINSLNEGLTVMLKTIVKKKTPDEMPTQIERETYRVATQKLSSEKLPNTSVSLQSGNTFHLPASIKLLDPVVALQTGIYSKNIFTWDRETSKNIKSKVQFLTFTDETGNSLGVENLDTPIEIKLESNLETLQNYQIELSLPNSFKEIEIEIPRSCSMMMTLEALQSASRETKLFVYLQYGKLASSFDYDVLITVDNGNISLTRNWFENDTSVSNDSSSRNVYANVTNKNIITMWNFHKFKYANSSNASVLYLQFHYEGPAAPVFHVGNNYTFDIYEIQSTYNYSLKLYCAGCVYWNVTSDKWRSDGCQIDLLKSNLKSITCLCNHLTSFGGFYVAPNPLPRLSFELLKQGYVLLVTVMILLLLWLIALLLLRRWDKNDESKIGITLLQDNHSNDNYLYEITILTGSRRNSGTTSNIYFMAVGSCGDSGTRKLEDSDRKLFQRSSSDVFVMAVPETLGELQCVKLWHDNSGGDWFVRSIEIVDLTTNERCEFIASRWLAVDKHDGRLYCVIPRAADDELTDFTYLFATKSRRDFTDTHIWFSLYARPVRSSFTRCQRLTVAVCMLMCVMLSSVMFYGQLPERKAETENRMAGFSFSWQQVYVALISSVITVPINLVLVTLFRSIEPNPVAQKWKSQHQKSKLTSKRYEENKKLLSKDKEQEEGEKNGCKNRIRRLFQLPYWCTYVTWILCLAVILTCGFLITLYGMSFGNMRSLDWLATVTIYLVQDILVVQPFKIVCGAMFIALIVKKLDEEEKSHIEKRARKLYKNKEWMQRNKKRRITLLNRVRIEKIKPPDEDNLKSMREIRIKERQMYAIIREIALYFVFTIVIFSIGYISRDPRSFRQTRDIEELLTLKPRMKLKYNPVKAFIRLKSHNDFWPWLEDVLIKRMFPHPWYSSLDSRYDDSPRVKDFPGRKFINDLYSKIVNGIRIRQVRVKPGSCKKHADVSKLTHHDCAPAYSINTEETRSFYFNWTVPTMRYKAGEIPTKYKPWTYQTWKELDSYPFVAELNSYFGGGYVLELFPRWNNTASLLELKRSLWIDRYSRAIFLEFALFNAATNLFSSVTVTLELPPGGGVIPYYSIITFRLHRYNINSALAVIISEVLFVILTIIFTLREIKMIYKEKWAYFKEFWNLVEFSNIILTGCAITFYVYRSILGKILMDKVNVKQPDKFINFQFAAYWDLCFVYIIALLCFFVTLKFLKILRFNQRICLLAHTLKSAWYPLSMFGICFAIIMIAMMVSSTMIFGTSLYGYRDISKTISSVIGLLLGKFDYYQFENTNRILGPVFFFTFNVFVNIIVMNMMISILNDVFASERSELISRLNEYEIVDFVINLIKDWLGIKRSKSNIEQLWLKTLQTSDESENLKIETNGEENKSVDEILNSKRWSSSASFLKIDEEREIFNDAIVEKLVHSLNYLYFDDADVAQTMTERILNETEIDDVY